LTKSRSAVPRGVRVSEPQAAGCRAKDPLDVSVKHGREHPQEVTADADRQPAESFI